MRERLCDSPHSHNTTDDRGSKSLPYSIIPAPLKDSYNVVYAIEFSDGVRWVARTTEKGTGFEELDIKKMDTDFQTMRFIKACTSIPANSLHMRDQ